MADFPTSLRPQRSTGDDRIARKMGIDPNTLLPTQRSWQDFDPQASKPRPTVNFSRSQGGQPFNSLVPESAPAVEMVNPPTGGGTWAQDLAAHNAGVKSVLTPPAAPAAPTGVPAPTTAPDANVGLPAAHSFAAPTAEGLRTHQVGLPAAHSFAAPTAEGLRTHQVGNVSGPQYNSSAPGNPSQDIQFDKTTNTFSNAAGRAASTSQPSLGMTAGGTPGHPTAAVDQTMSNLASHQDGYQLQQARIGNVANQGNMVHFKDGGMLDSIKGLFKESPEQQMARVNAKYAAQDAAARAPAPAQAPTQVAAPVNNITNYSSGASTAAKMQALGLRNGGTVPGHGTGDKIPAMYEPGEFVVSNAMMKKDPSLRGHLKKVQKVTLASQGKTVAGATKEALHGPVLHAQGSFSGGIEDLIYDEKTGSYSPPPQPEPAMASAADDAAMRANQAYHTNASRAVVPVAGTGRTGGYDFYDKPGSPGAVGGNGGASPKPSGAWGATVDGLRGNTAAPPTNGGSAWGATVDGLRDGAKTNSMWDKVKTGAQGLVPEGVNWKNPFAAAKGGGITVGNAGVAATDAAANAGKYVRANAGKIAGPASNLFGVLGHYDAYGPNSPLSIGEQAKLLGQDVLRVGGTALGGAFGGGVGTATGPVGTFAGTAGGAYLGDKYAHKGANALFHGDEILTSHHMNPEQNIIGRLMSGDPAKESATAAQTAPATPAVQAAASGTPQPALRGSAFTPSEEDVQQRLANTEKDRRLGDSMGQERLQQAAQGRVDQAAQGQVALDAQARWDREKGIQAARIEASSKTDLRESARGEAALEGYRQQDLEGLRQRGETLRGAATNTTNLRAHQITADAAVLGHQLSNQAARANARMEWMSKDRDYQLRREEFGNTKDKQTFDNGQTAAKNYADQLGSKYVTDVDGKQGPDQKAVSEHMSGAQAYLEGAAKRARDMGDHQGAARIEKGGFAHLTEQDKSVIDQGMAMKRLVAQNKGVAPWAGTMVDSPNPADYAIDLKRSTDSHYVLRNGSKIPRSAVDGGFTFRHPFSSIGAPESRNFTSIGQ
jgi:hypothetical protein